MATTPEPSVTPTPDPGTSGSPAPPSPGSQGAAASDPGTSSDKGGAGAAPSSDPKKGGKKPAAKKGKPTAFGGKVQDTQKARRGGRKSEAQKLREEHEAATVRREIEKSEMAERLPEAENLVRATDVIATQLTRMQLDIPGYEMQRDAAVDAMQLGDQEIKGLSAAVAAADIRLTPEIALVLAVLGIYGPRMMMVKSIADSIEADIKRKALDERPASPNIPQDPDPESDPKKETT